MGGKVYRNIPRITATGALSEQEIAIVMTFADKLRRSLKCDTQAELRSELSSEPPTMQPLPVQALPEQLPAGREGLSTGLSGNPRPVRRSPAYTNQLVLSADAWDELEFAAKRRCLRDSNRTSQAAVPMPPMGPPLTSDEVDAMEQPLSIVVGASYYIRWVTASRHVLW